MVKHKKLKSYLMKLLLYINKEKYLFINKDYINDVDLSIGFEFKM